MGFIRYVILFGVLTCLMLISISFNSLDTNTTFVSIEPTIDLNFTNYNDDYCVLYDYWVSDREFDDKITFVVHASVDYLHYLKKHLNGWTGAISMAIQIPWPINRTVADENFRSILARLDNLATVQYSNKVSVHLFYKKTTLTDTCEQFRFVVSDLNDMANHTVVNTDEVYPINVARNVARKGSRTRLFISGDIENYFSVHYEKRMRVLAAEELLRKNRSIVLVHRRFEVDTGVKLPEDKVQLQKYFSSGKAVVFHRYFYQVGHFIPGIDEWMAHTDTQHNISMQMVIPYHSPRWEPQFVGDTTKIPYHDESFPFRMSSNTHLGSEMCRMGVEFGVVHDLFTVHVGIKRSERKSELLAKKLAWANGYKKVVQDFVARLDLQYPNTTKDCPQFVP